MDKADEFLVDGILALYLAWASNWHFTGQKFYRVRKYLSTALLRTARNRRVDYNKIVDVDLEPE